MVSVPTTPSGNLLVKNSYAIGGFISMSSIILLSLKLLVTCRVTSFQFGASTLGILKALTPGAITDQVFVVVYVAALVFTTSQFVGSY